MLPNHYFQEANSISIWKNTTNFINAYACRSFLQALMYQVVANTRQVWLVIYKIIHLSVLFFRSHTTTMKGTDFDVYTWIYYIHNISPSSYECSKYDVQLFRNYILNAYYFIQIVYGFRTVRPFDRLIYSCERRRSLSTFSKSIDVQVSIGLVENLD